MLIYVKTNLFDSPAQVLVNTVNTVGVMGKGIALEFKKLYPLMFSQYQKFCETGQLTVGKLWIYRTTNKWILNFPTKRNWRQKSRLEDIEAGLKKFRETYREQGITSISFPQLGVGNGGLNWESQVQPLMERYLSDLPIKIYVHLYNGKQNPPEYQDSVNMKQWLQSAPQVLSAQEFKTEFMHAQPSSPFMLDGRQIEIKNESPTNHLDSISAVFMTISQNNRRYALSQADIIDFWTKMRQNGLVMASDFPSLLWRHQDIDVFEKMVVKLPYVEVSHITVKGQQQHTLILKHGALPHQEVAEVEIG